MTGTLQADKFGDVFKILSEDELPTFCNYRYIAYAELQQAFATLWIVQYVDGNKINFFARKKLFRPEAAASPGLGEQDELIRSGHV